MRQLISLMKPSSFMTIGAILFLIGITVYLNRRDEASQDELKEVTTDKAIEIIKDEETLKLFSLIIRQLSQPDLAEKKMARKKSVSLAEAIEREVPVVVILKKLHDYLKSLIPDLDKGMLWESPLISPKFTAQQQKILFNVKTLFLTLAKNIIKLSNLKLAEERIPAFKEIFATLQDSEEHHSNYSSPFNPGRFITAIPDVRKQLNAFYPEISKNNDKIHGHQLTRVASFSTY